MKWRLFLIAGLLFCSEAAAAQGTLPDGLQVSLLQKVLTFDRALVASGGTVEVAVIYQSDYPQSAAAKAAFMRAATAASAQAGIKLRFRAVNIEGTMRFEDVFTVAGAQVAYLMPLRGIDVKSLSRAAASRGVRTASAVADYVYEGVSVTLGVKAGRPSININLKSCRSQGSDFSSQLLKLATVVE
jgi:hypothetical protein